MKTNCKFLQILFGLLTINISFALLSMDDYKIGQIIAYEPKHEHNIVCNYMQKMEQGKFLAHAEIIRGSL